MATRNRRDDLRRAIESCLSQTVPVEVIIRDDASTDGTEEMVRQDFPMVDYRRSAEPRGSIANRNDAVRAARTPFIISIDDDAAFPSPRTVEQTIRDFDDPRVGAVAIPYIDVLKSPVVEQLSKEPDKIWVMAYFRGCAAAWRREVFLGVGGYSPVLYHMAEEPELCMKLVDAGYVTRMGRADPIHHYESPKRDPRRVMKLVARNGLLVPILNTPGLMLPIHVAGTMFKSIRYGVKSGAIREMAGGLLEGWTLVPRAWRARRSMSLSAYFLYRWLLKRVYTRLDEFQNRLPPRRQFASTVPTERP